MENREEHFFKNDGWTKKGCIINISSMAAQQALTRVLGYSASKAAIDNFTKWMAVEMANKFGAGIRVNAIAPGYIATDNTEALRNDPDRFQSILDRIPAGRWGEPEDFGGPAVFLASDAARYMHGHIMLVDGGWMGR